MPQTKIGLEVHVYIDVSQTRQKLFCTCQVNPTAPPNTTICPRCTGQPGSKPMLPNREAVEKVLKTALMLNCRLNKDLIWQRKHYDWPDMPHGYQKTMSGSYAVPVGETGEFLSIGIRECHLEEDPARWDPVSGCVDYNRSGYPLIEIVTEPDFQSTEQVRDWLRKLMTTLSYVKAVDREMGIKCDVNVSVAPNFWRVEIKNVNSFKSIIKAIEYEAKRQEQEIKQGKRIEQQTRAWVDEEGVTKFMRSKEQALDYMFIPDPDLPVVEVSKELLDHIKAELPEKPAEKIKKMMQQGVPKETAEIIAADLALANLFEKLAMKIDPMLAAKWMRKELLHIINLSEKEVEEIEKHETYLIELLELLKKKEITEEIGRKILEELVQAQKPFSPKKYVEQKGLKAIGGAAELENYCLDVIKKFPNAVSDYKSGRQESLDFLVGQVMKLTKGKAKPQEVKEMFKGML